jgi:ribosome-associated toxin RatA of RatAB toxin-antitoxin module
VSNIEKTIDVDVPVRAAYNQWTQFTEFPRFMEGVERVEQLNDTMTHWVTRIAGVTREFDAQIVEQEPDRVVHWRSVKGPRQEGEVLFEVLDEDRTRVKLNMHFDPEGMVEKAADAMRLVARRAEADLERFKRFIEERGVETGAWRGKVEEGREESPAGPASQSEDIPGVTAAPGAYGATGVGTGGAAPGRSGTEPVSDEDVSGTERSSSIPADRASGADAGTASREDEERADTGRPPESPEDPDRPRL